MKENKIILEGCIDSQKDAKYFADHQIDRLEVCSLLEMGGLSPEIELVNYCINELKVDSVIMLRNRNDFDFEEYDLDIFKDQVREYKKVGGKHFIFGFNLNGKVDVNACEKIITLLKGCTYSYHMAIDETADIFESIETLIKLGFTRVLTKGGQGIAEKNLNTLKQLIHKYGDKIQILVGGKVTKGNWEKIKDYTGASQFHGRKIK